MFCLFDWFKHMFILSTFSSISTHRGASHLIVEKYLLENSAVNIHQEPFACSVCARYYECTSHLTRTLDLCHSEIYRVYGSAWVHGYTLCPPNHPTGERLAFRDLISCFRGPICNTLGAHFPHHQAAKPANARCTRSTRLRRSISRAEFMNIK